MVKKQVKSKHIRINKKKFIRTLIIILLIIILVISIKNAKKVPVSDKTIVILQKKS